MAASSRARTKACALPPRLDPFCGCVLAVLLVALSIHAARSRGGALSSDGSDADLALKASFQLTPEGAAARTQRGRDVQTAADSIDFINVQDYHHLGHVKNILERLEDIRARLTSFRTARDPRHRQIRRLLRVVEAKGDALKVMADKLEAEGHVGDGGDELPTQRDNICGRISEYSVEKQFAQMVQLFCELLGGVRKAVTAGEDEEPMAYSVSGLFITLTKEPDYRQGHIGWEIERVVGEERWWVSKHLAPRSAGTGNGLPSPEVAQTRLRRWDPRIWHTWIWEDVEGDSAATPIKALQTAEDTLVSAAAEDDLSLSSVRIRIQLLEVVKSDLADIISSSDPAFRERIRDLLQEIKSRMDALRTLAARKFQAGEVDNSSELLPSQRDSICANLEAFDLEEDFRDDVRKLCETFDRLHLVAHIELERNRGGFEVLGRVAALDAGRGIRTRPSRPGSSISSRKSGAGCSSRRRSLMRDGERLRGRR